MHRGLRLILCGLVTTALLAVVSVSGCGNDGTVVVRPPAEVTPRATATPIDQGAGLDLP